MSKWSDYYKDRINERYERHIKKRYHPFIQTIAEQIKDYNNKGVSPVVVELGCGIGSITKALLKNNSIDAFHYLIDIDAEMLKLALKNIGESNYVSMLQTDIRAVRGKGTITPHIVHSHGVLEHMSNKDIQRTISNWLDQKHFHYVPSHKYEEPSFGDERLLDARTWETITGSWVVEFNDGYDYMLIR